MNGAPWRQPKGFSINALDSEERLPSFPSAKRMLEEEREEPKSERSETPLGKERRDPEASSLTLDQGLPQQPVSSLEAFDRQKKWKQSGQGGELATVAPRMATVEMCRTRGRRRWHSQDRGRRQL